MCPQFQHFESFPDKSLLYIGRQNKNRRKFPVLSDFCRVAKKNRGSAQPQWVVKNRKKCVTPVAIVSAHCYSPLFSMWHYYPSFLPLPVCLLAPSVSHSLSDLTRRFSLTILHLSVWVWALVFSFPPLPCMLHRLQAQVPRAEKL